MVEGEAVVSHGGERKFGGPEVYVTPPIDTTPLSGNILCAFFLARTCSGSTRSYMFYMLLNRFIWVLSQCCTSES